MNCYRNEIKKFKIEILAKEYSFRLHHKGFVIDRNCVEKKLLDRARENGAKLILGNRVINFELPNKIYLEKGKIKGKVIIDASGIACIIGRKIGMDTRLKPQDIGICIQSRVLSNFEKETIKIRYHKPFTLGYSWIFPFSDELANIGIGIPGGQKIDL